MLRQGKLFLRMFISFWLVSIAILGSWMLAANYFESQPPGRAWGDHDRSSPPHRYMLRVIYKLENLDDHEVATAVEEIRRMHNIQIYLVLRNGVDLLKRELPPEVARIAQRLRADDHSAMLNEVHSRLSAHRIYRPYEGEVTAVFVFPPNPDVILDALGEKLWLRIALAALVSAAVCFVLSRLMTNRLQTLQLAARRLANGNLDTRLQIRERYTDETDELARDFNSMAEQLQARIQAQKRLLADVSHELRSPLARLRVALALAQDKPDNALEYLGRIEQETERLEELIGQLLATQSKDIALDTHIDLVPLLQQLCADVNFEGQGENKRFRFTSDCAQATIASSGDLLRRSFENILRNALQHTASNSEVWVSLYTRNDYYCVTIEDHGPGVPAEELQNIFGEFYRLDTARSPASGGYGLGLAIARGAVWQHGGDVTADNTGSGLRVTVRLPASATN